MTLIARSVAVAFALTWCVLCSAVDIAPLRADQVAEVFRSYQGKPLIVEIWSLDCSYCRENVERIAQWHHEHEEVHVIMVCMDPISEADQLSSVLESLKAEAFSQYANAESIPEKLQGALDSSWHGETPRTLLIDRQGRRSASSGMLRAELLTQVFGGS